MVVLATTYILWNHYYYIFIKIKKYLFSQAVHKGQNVTLMVSSMVIRVVEFSSGGYKIRKIFA